MIVMSLEEPEPFRGSYISGLLVNYLIDVFVINNYYFEEIVLTEYISKIIQIINLYHKKT